MGAVIQAVLRFVFRLAVVCLLSVGVAAVLFTPLAWLCLPGRTRWLFESGHPEALMLTVGCALAVGTVACVGAPWLCAGRPRRAAAWIHLGAPVLVGVVVGSFLLVLWTCFGPVPPGGGL